LPHITLAFRPGNDAAIKQVCIASHHIVGAPMTCSVTRYSCHASGLHLLNIHCIHGCCPVPGLPAPGGQGQPG
jgi:hypothetical protein